MALGLAVVVTLIVVALIVVPLRRLGRQLRTRPEKQDATPGEQAERKRARAVRRKEELAVLRLRERILLYAYYAFSLPTLPVGSLLTVFGHGPTRTIGVVLLCVAVVLMAVPVGPILGGRIRRRKRASSQR